MKFYGHIATTIHVGGIPETVSCKVKLAKMLSYYLDIEIKPEDIKRGRGKLFDTKTKEFLFAPYCDIILNKKLSEKGIKLLHEKVQRVIGMKLTVSKAKYQIIKKEDKIWNNPQIKRTKRSGDNSAWDEPARYIFKEEGRIIMKTTEEVNKYQEKKQNIKKYGSKQISKFIQQRQQEKIDRSTNLFTGHVTEKHAKGGMVKIYKIKEEVYFRATEIKQYDWSRVKKGDVFGFTVILKGDRILVKNMMLQSQTVAPYQPQRVHINKTNNNNNNNPKAWRKRQNNNKNENNINNNNNNNNNNKFGGLSNKNKHKSNNNIIGAGPKQFLKASVNIIKQKAHRTFNIKDNMDNNNNSASEISSISPITSPAVTSDENINIIETNEDVDVRDVNIRQGTKRGKQPDMKQEEITADNNRKHKKKKLNKTITTPQQTQQQLQQQQQNNVTNQTQTPRTTNNSKK